MAVIKFSARIEKSKINETGRDSVEVEGISSGLEALNVWEGA